MASTAAPRRCRPTATAQYGYHGYSEASTSDNLLLCTFRWYDPATARWLTRDPIGYAGGSNLYGYVGGNPVGGVDPWGLRRDPFDLTGANAYAEAGDWDSVVELLGKLSPSGRKVAQAGITTSLEEEIQAAFAGRSHSNESPCNGLARRVSWEFRSRGLKPIVVRLELPYAGVRVGCIQVSTTKHHYATYYGNKVFDITTGKVGMDSGKWFRQFPKGTRIADRMDVDRQEENWPGDYACGENCWCKY
jgi:RHS repeat-associated protein